MGACASNPAVHGDSTSDASEAKVDGVAQKVGTVKAKPGFGSAAVTSISAGGGAENVSSSAPRNAAPGPTASQLNSADRAQPTGRSAAAASLEQRQPSSRSKPPLARPSSSLPLPLPPDREAPASTSGRTAAPQQHAEAAGNSVMRHLAQSRASSTSAFAHSSSYLPPEPDGAGHPVSLTVAMSMPGEREAQQMLRGVSPLCRTQSVLDNSAQQMPPGKGGTGGASIGACAERRGAAALEQKPEPGVDHILGLAMSVFRTDSVVLHLRDGDQVFVRGGCSLFSPVVRSQACRLLEPPASSISIVEDTQSHPRLKQRPDITAQLKFFAGAPLIAANGYRLGSLCLCHTKQRAFNAGEGGILGNMAELMVREIWGAYEGVHQHRINQLVRVVDCYSEPHAFVEVSETAPWRLLHINQAALRMTGLEGAAVSGKPFWDVFTGIIEGNAVKKAAVAAKSASGSGFDLEGMRAASINLGDAVPLTLVFRPAARETLTVPMEKGKPGEKPRPVSNAGRHYYLVGVHMEGPTMQTSAGERTPFVGLTLGLLLGKGSYGRVYKGYWHGRVVAVKVCDSAKVRRNKDGLPVEVDLSARLVHPNLVRTIEASSVRRDAAPRLDWELPTVAEGDETIRSRSSLGSAPRSSSLESAAAAVAGVADGSGPGREHAGGAAGPPGEARGAGEGGRMGKGECGGAGLAPVQEAQTQQQQQQEEQERKPEEETWLLLEYCDQGTLVDAIIGGWFRTEPGGTANIMTVLATAMEIASGMAFLHSRDIVHGDLSSGNILLTSGQTTNPHGFCAKVSDFGLARDMDLVSRVETKTTGTVTHMPPELLSDGIISKAADVYAFGVLLWEMLTGGRAWEGLTPAQVMLAVALNQQRLSYPAWSPPELTRLGEQCLQFDANKRPMFSDVDRMLKAIHGSLGDERVELNKRALSCPR